MLITFKSDGEFGIVTLKRAVANRRVAATVPIESPVREINSNGAIEVAIKTWHGQFRALRHRLEDHLKQKVPLAHAIFGWLTMWASKLICKSVVRSNGRTAYEHITGHRCKHPVVIFGETVW